MDKKNYWVYILHCANDTYYTGYTTNVTARYQAHLAGKCKYTRSFKPQSIAQYFQIGDKSLAMRVEAYIKKLPRVKKLALIAKPELITEVIEELR